MAIDKNFKIKNGLTVGDVEIVSSTGEWVGPASGLVGPKGDTGDTGATGADGAPGADGPPGPPGADGLNGLDGYDGAAGANGLSAYEIAVNNGFVGTEAQWIAGLVTATSTHTLTNKTLTSPTINAGALSGTFSGNHTKSGIVTFSNNTASSSTTTGAVIVTGGVGIGGNLFVGGALTESSSAILKENIKPIDGALNLILQLNGVIYDRKDGSRKNEAGLIAEDVFKVLPNLVQLDDEGNPMGVEYTKLTAYLIECIKELKLEIETLKQK